nr:MAG TPA: hypothetical protein [Crassvirales sp.]DAI34987.1 MAG TPA: hypothetical protein [Caudoviricetes sp.]
MIVFLDLIEVLMTYPDRKNIRPLLLLLRIEKLYLNIVLI